MTSIKQGERPAGFNDDCNKSDSRKSL